MWNGTLRKKIHERTLKLEEEIVLSIKKTESLQVSEEKYKDLVAQLPETVWELDEKGTYTFINLHGLHSFGYTTEGLNKGLSIFQTMAPEDCERARENLEKRVRGEQFGSNEYIMVRKDGTRFPALIRMVEAKAPFTSGHQKRVADLARTIAREMGFSHKQIEGIRVAGSLHDLGMIGVPGEILSSPRTLTDYEFVLIKTHPVVGYDILKDVEFPWPVADIIVQHHEHKDGSGYPYGVQGEAILPEARILAVADVVEAVASHRPYRPAMSIDAALEIINSGRGNLYDPPVVDTCVRLFREKGYQLKES